LSRAFNPPRPQPRVFTQSTRVIPAADRANRQQSLLCATKSGKLAADLRRNAQYPLKRYTAPCVSEFARDLHALTV
jgi:hypothetical protein